MAKSAASDVQFADAQHIDPRDDLLADYAEQTGQDERGSEMVKDEAMTQDMRPPPEIASEQDRETFDAKWHAEQQNTRGDLLADYTEQVVERGMDRSLEL